MPSASAIRLQIESALAARIPAALTPTARVVRPVAPTGIAALDEALHGGLPVGAITELIGPECSGRTSVALAFVAGMTQAGRACAWLDVSNALDPASAAAAGVDLRRLLWVRCGARKTGAALAETTLTGQRFSLPERYLIPKPAIKGLHGGGCGGHPRGEVKGMAQAVSGLLQPLQKDAMDATILKGRDRGTHPVGGSRANTALKGSRALAPEGRSSNPEGVFPRHVQTEIHRQPNIAPRCAEPQRHDGSPLAVAALKNHLIGAGLGLPNPELGGLVSGHGFSRAGNYPQMNGALAPEKCFSRTLHGGPKPWARLDQALRAADLLLQGGGFSAIVLDFGSLAPEFASRLPLATWFRYRAAAESTQASLLLLAQCGCARSSAELTLRLEPGDALKDEPTLFTGMAHSVEVARRRFTGALDNVVPLRKPPQRANVANWQSRASWAGVR
ncbi:MAG: recombinase RecA [Terracidiphilus sp.]